MADKSKPKRQRQSSFVDISLGDLKKLLADKDSVNIPVNRKWIDAARLILEN